jgi:hypothetical protein
MTSMMMIHSCNRRNSNFSIRLEFLFRFTQQGYDTIGFTISKAIQHIVRAAPLIACSMERASRTTRSRLEDEGIAEEVEAVRAIVAERIAAASSNRIVVEDLRVVVNVTNVVLDTAAAAGLRNVDHDTCLVEIEEGARDDIVSSTETHASVVALERIAVEFGSRDRIGGPTFGIATLIAEVKIDDDGSKSCHFVFVIFLIIAHTFSFFTKKDLIQTRKKKSIKRKLFDKQIKK